jgi:hypothetical protein
MALIVKQGSKITPDVVTICELPPSQKTGEPLKTITLKRDWWNKNIFIKIGEEEVAIPAKKLLRAILFLNPD